MKPNEKTHRIRGWEAVDLVIDGLDLFIIPFAVLILGLNLGQQRAPDHTERKRNHRG